MRAWQMFSLLAHGKGIKKLHRKQVHRRIICSKSIRRIQSYNEDIIICKNHIVFFFITTPPCSAAVWALRRALRSLRLGWAWGGQHTFDEHGPIWTIWIGFYIQVYFGSCFFCQDQKQLPVQQQVAFQSARRVNSSDQSGGHSSIDDNLHSCGHRIVRCPTRAVSHYRAGVKLSAIFKVADRKPKFFWVAKAKTI